MAAQAAEGWTPWAARTAAAPAPAAAPPPAGVHAGGKAGAPGAPAVHVVHAPSVLWPVVRSAWQREVRLGTRPAWLSACLFVSAMAGVQVPFIAHPHPKTWSGGAPFH